jgi:hypothetical protein
MEVSKCSATTRSGLPCENKAVAEGFCTFHLPAGHPLRKANASKGGRNRSNANRWIRSLPAEAMDAEDLSILMSAAARDLWDGTKPPLVVNALSTLTRAYNDLLKTRELEERIAAIEESLKESAGDKTA